MPANKHRKSIVSGIVLLVAASGLALFGAYDYDSEDAPATRGITVIDGDTIEFNKQYFDLAGIDAPELGQRCEEGGNLYPCGEDAAFALDKLVGLQHPECIPIEKGADAGKVVCTTGQTDLGANLIKDGLAVALEPGTENYQTLERAAKASDLGIWRGPFVVPKKWRAGERLTAESATPFECPVLGLKVDGKLVFVVPTDSSHQALSKEKDNIIENFCSDEDARAKGYEHQKQEAAS
jgi:endonuclease YncB( thermonuclease family)